MEAFFIGRDGLNISSIIFLSYYIFSQYSSKDVRQNLYRFNLDLASRRIQSAFDLFEYKDP